MSFLSIVGFVWIILAFAIFFAAAAGLLQSEEPPAFKKALKIPALVYAACGVLLLYFAITEVFIANYSGVKVEGGEGEALPFKTGEDWFFGLLPLAQFLVAQLLWIPKFRKSLVPMAWISGFTVFYLLFPV